MPEIKKLDEFVKRAQAKQTRRIAVVAAEDEPVLKALKEAISLKIAYPILLGDEKKILEIGKDILFDTSELTIIHEPDSRKAAKKAIDLISRDEADILMKGLISSSSFLRAILDKDEGLRKKNGVISHVAFFETPYYHKIVCVTDAAMNVAPSFKEKRAILENAVEAFHKLGNSNPKVAVIGAVETVNPSMEATVHAAMLTMMNKRGQIRSCVVDGPLAFDNAVSLKAAAHKGITSPVAGDVDIILTPEINSGNILYKSLNFMGGATVAAVIMGAKVPVVLTSRADSDKSKLMSVALAAAMD